MTEPQGPAAERWTRLYAEMRANQARAALEPRERFPLLALVVLGALVFFLWYFLMGGIWILGPVLKPFFP